jgi:hypothetical protein
MRTTRVMSLLSVFLLAPAAGMAATYPELAERFSRKAVPVPYYQVIGNGNGPSSTAPANGGVATAYPAYGNTAMYMLPSGTNGMPDARQVRWTYGQVNAASDPYYVWGLRSQRMYVPWSTPMSGWTNAQSWDWWRHRAGDNGPAPPLW